MQMRFVILSLLNEYILMVYCRSYNIKRTDSFQANWLILTVSSYEV